MMKMKQILAWVLALTMVVTMGIAGLVLPASAEGETPVDLYGGIGSFEDGRTTYTKTPFYSIAPLGKQDAVVNDPTDSNNKVLQLGIGTLNEETGEYEGPFNVSERYFKHRYYLYNPTTETFSAGMKVNTCYTLTFRAYGDSFGMYFSSYFKRISSNHEGSGSQWYRFGGAKDAEGNYIWKTYTIVFYGVSGKVDWADFTPTIKKSGESQRSNAGPSYIDDITLIETPASGISASATSLTLNTGASSEALTVSATPLYSKLSGDVVWSSSSEKIASVDPVTGVVTGHLPGTATITATVGELTTTVAVTVKDPSKVIAENFEGDTQSAYFPTWWNKGTVETDPDDDQNKAFKFTTAITGATYAGANGPASAVTDGAWYSIRMRVKGSLTFNINTDKIFGAKSCSGNAVNTHGKWQTINYIVQANRSKSWDGYALYLLRATAGTYIDDFEVVEIDAPSDAALFYGADFENDAESAWAAIISSGATVEKDPLNENNHALYFPADTTRGGAYYRRNLPLETNTTYRLTMDVYGKNVAVYLNPAKGIVSGGGKWYHFSSTNGWKQVSILFEVGASYTPDGHEVSLGLQGSADDYPSDGVYIDNIRITPVEGEEVNADEEIVGGSLTFKTKDYAAAESLQLVEAKDVVTVTVTPEEGYIMVPGSLKYTGVTSGAEVKILNEKWSSRPTFGRASAGNTFEFEMPAEAVTVTAEFVSVEEQNFAMDSVGTAIRENGVQEEGKTYYGIRFLTRMNLATKFDAEANEFTVTYGGENYTVLKMGSKLTRVADGHEFDDAVAYEHGGSMKLVDYTDAYIDFASVMKTVATDREYTAKGYIVIDLNSNGAADANEYIYSTNDQTDSVQSVATRLGITLN